MGWTSNGEYGDAHIPRSVKAAPRKKPRTKYDPFSVEMAASALGESRRGRPGMACLSRSDMLLALMLCQVAATGDQVKTIQDCQL